MTRLLLFLLLNALLVPSECMFRPMSIQKNCIDVREYFAVRGENSYEDDEDNFYYVEDVEETTSIGNQNILNDQRTSGGNMHLAVLGNSIQNQNQQTSNTQNSNQNLSGSQIQSDISSSSGKTVQSNNSNLNVNQKSTDEKLVIQNQNQKSLEQKNLNQNLNQNAAAGNYQSAASGKSVQSQQQLNLNQHKIAADMTGKSSQNLNQNTNLNQKLSSSNSQKDINGVVDESVKNQKVKIDQVRSDVSNVLKNSNSNQLASSGQITSNLNQNQNRNSLEFNSVNGVQSDLSVLKNINLNQNQKLTTAQIQIQNANLKNQNQINNGAQSGKNTGTQLTSNSQNLNQKSSSNSETDLNSVVDDSVQNQGLKIAQVQSDVSNALSKSNSNQLTSSGQTTSNLNMNQNQNIQIDASGKSIQVGNFKTLNQGSGVQSDSSVLKNSNQQNVNQKLTSAQIQVQNANLKNQNQINNGAQSGKSIGTQLASNSQNLNQKSSLNSIQSDLSTGKSVQNQNQKSSSNSRTDINAVVDESVQKQGVKIAQVQSDVSNALRRSNSNPLISSGQTTSNLNMNQNQKLQSDVAGKFIQIGNFKSLSQGSGVQSDASGSGVCSKAASGNCETGWRSFKRPSGEWCMKIFYENSVIQSVAEERCQAQGAVLSGLQNQIESQFVFSTVTADIYPESGSIWIGLKRRKECMNIGWTPACTAFTSFEWTDKSANGTDGLAWACNQPDNARGATQNCAALTASSAGTVLGFQTGLLDDVGCDFDYIKMNRQARDIKAYVCGKKPKI